MYSDEQRQDIQDRICRFIRAGDSLKKILETQDDMPSRDAVYSWLHEDLAFSDNYTRAREAQADYYADEITTIADTATDANLARVQIDARKWAAGKLKPKVYGERLQLDGEVNVTLSDEQLELRLAQLIGKAGAAVVVRGEGSAEETP